MTLFQPVNPELTDDRRFWRRLPHVIAFAIATLAYGFSGLEWLEFKLMDLRFELTRKPTASDTVFIGIDSRSLQELAKWPWPRNYHADIVRRLNKAGAARIALDIDLSSASTPAADQALADAIAEASGKVVLPVFKQRAASTDNSIIYTEPLALFRANAQTAAINVQPESDSTVRRYNRVETWQVTYVPSLATQLSGALPTALDSFYIDYGFRPESVPYISYVDILRDRFPPEQLRGKTVVVGAAAIELGDMLAVPVYAAMPGAMLQILAHESLASGRAIQRTHSTWSYLAGLLLAIFFGPFLNAISWIRGLAASTAVTALAFGGSVWAQALSPLSVDLALPLLVVWLSYFWSLARQLDLQSIRIYKQHMASIHRRELMSSIFDGAFEGIVLTNADGRIELANPAACRLFDMTPDQLAGGNILEFIDPPPVKRADTTLKTGETDRRVVARSVRADLTTSSEHRIPIEASVTIAQLAPGHGALERRKTPRYVHIYTVRDIRDRIQAEAALRSAADKALAADRAKSELLANVSHELRTPLNAIIGFSQVMQQQVFGPLGNPKYQTYTKDILYSGEHLLDLVNNLLSISRLDSGEYDVHEDRLDLRETARACAKIVGSNLKGKEVKIDVDIPLATPKVRGDLQSIRQIFLNLLGNAVKFTPDGGNVRVTAETDSTGRLALIVTDNGIGIAKADLPTVTQPFRQVDGSTSRQHGGVGLGLHIVSRLVDLHDCEMRIESELGVGTRVTILFPLNRIEGFDNVVTLTDRQNRTDK